MYNQRMADSRHYEDPVAKIDNGGLFSRERCRQLTQYLSLYFRQLFDMYDDNKDGVLETITAGKMLMDLYRSMNKEFHPTATDIASYQRIFDRDNKGKITFDDMERFAVRYYCNEE